jgi:hypothetical protein
MRTRRSGSTIIALLIVLVSLGGEVGAGAATRGAPQALAQTSGARAAAQKPSDSCNPNTDTMSAHDAARHLMAGRYKLGHHPLVTLGRRLSWSEDPLRDRNWRERLHMLRFLMALMIEWQDTRDGRYRDRAFALLRSWIAHNPRSRPASAYAWGDHSTAWRTMTMVCIARMVPRQAWLVRAISTHGAVLADPRFYVGSDLPPNASDGWSRAA